MSSATQPLIQRIAIVFDFDETLAPDSFDALLDHGELDPQTFRRERVKPLTDAGWEDILARFHCLIETRRRDDLHINKEFLSEVGRNLPLYDGVPQMFDALREAAHAVLDGIEVEFYLLTAGFVEIPRAMSIASEFTQTWGCEFAYDKEGNIAFPKQIVTHAEKTRYILALAKGIDVGGGNEPEDVYRDVPEAEMHVPLDQMIYVGDGASDMPVFSLLNSDRGIAIGIVNAEETEEWAGYEAMHAGRRVQNLAPADYSEGSELMRSLVLAVESISQQIALRRLGKGE